MKKKKVLIPALVAVLILVGIVLCNAVTNYSRVIEANWGIALPGKAVCKEIYEMDSGPSPHGDGIRYHVFSYKYEDYIELMFAWPPVEKETLFHATTSEAAEEWLDLIEVPKDQRPHYAGCSSWHKSQHDNSEIIFFWDNDLNRLYVVEHFL